MGVPVNYDDDAEKRRTDPRLLSPPETEGEVSASDTKVLQDAGVVTSKLREPLRDTKNVSLPALTKQTRERRSVLGVSKYGPGSGPHWKNNGARYPTLYEAIIKDTATGSIAPTLLCYRGRENMILKVIAAPSG